MKYLFYNCCNCGYELRLAVELAGAKPDATETAIDARGPSPIAMEHATIKGAEAMTMPDILRAEYSPQKLSRSDIDPATLEPNPSPLDRLNIALRHVNEASKTLTNDRAQLEGIEATLYVNFVSKDCHGVKFSAEEIAGWSVSKLLFEILLKLHGEIDRLKQQIAAGLANDCQRIANPRCGGSTPPDASD